MATTKSTKKPVKRTTTKKVAAKAPRKQTVARKSTKKTAEMKSFKVYKNPVPFRSFAITRQTVYWIILLLVIVVMQLWILKIQIEIAELTNILLDQQLN